MLSVISDDPEWICVCAVCSTVMLGAARVALWVLLCFECFLTDCYLADTVL